MSISEMFPAYTLPEYDIKSRVQSEPGTSYEVFRNNTTAVEVIVKEVPRDKKNSKTSSPNDAATKQLQEEIEKLKKELQKANIALQKARKGFPACIREMKKQLDSANQWEINTRNKNLALQLENEKLKSLLASKNNLINRLKKEMSSLKRVIKYVIKSLAFAPQTEALNMTYSSDPDYDDFESDLKKEYQVKFAPYNEVSTFDSTVSKEPKLSFDKRLFE